jgi:hypothetical protein
MNAASLVVDRGDGGTFSGVASLDPRHMLKRSMVVFAFDL